jgi:hypothetical protein
MGFLRGVRVFVRNAKKPGFPEGDPRVSWGFRGAHISGDEATPPQDVR